MIRARSPAPVPAPAIRREPHRVTAYLEDASGAPPGRAAGVACPESEAEAAALLAATLPAGTAILCQAARTSLTAGAIPRGELVVSVERMRERGPVEAETEGARVRVGPGVRLDELARELAALGFYYPPVPTYQQAMIGGTVSTNAGGAATFKYGVTRQWVRGLRVALFNGELLELERGQATAVRGESFHIGLASGGELRVPVPVHRLPDLRKISAGYHAADVLDLVDLFVGAEGTLGLITEVTLDLVRAPAGVVVVLAFVPGWAQALSLAAALRTEARAARAAQDPRGPDVRSIEVVDGRGLELLRRHGDDRRLRVELPTSAGAALLLEMELARPLSTRAADEALLAALEARATDDPLGRLLALLGRHARLDEVSLALPGDEARGQALREFREAVPHRVAELLAERRHRAPGVRKLGGDMIVPFEHVAEMVAVYERGFVRRGLEGAIWGHLSDGNLHANVLARDETDVASGTELLLELGDEAVRLGGAPLSEHGVGRDPIKQQLLRRFLGEAALQAMARTKHGLDPPGRFAPGVLFPAQAEPGAGFRSSARSS